jgi:hypothetical protein
MDAFAHVPEGRSLSCSLVWKSIGCSTSFGGSASHTSSSKLVPSPVLLFGLQVSRHARIKGLGLVAITVPSAACAFADAYTVLSPADQYALQFRVMRGTGAKH